MSADAGDHERPTSCRVFFALWPDDATRTQIVRATREPVRLSGGRPTSKERLHVTVAFLGALTEGGLEIARGVPPIEVGAFDLALDQIGAFANGGVLWLGPRTVPPALVELQRRLWEELEACGFVHEERVDQPHVTLARRARPVEAEVDGAAVACHRARARRVAARRPQRALRGARNLVPLITGQTTSIAVQYAVARFSSRTEWIPDADRVLGYEIIPHVARPARRGLE